jgi:hypothetical protein
MVYICFYVPHTFDSDERHMRPTQRAKHAVSVLCGVSINRLPIARLHLDDRQFGSDVDRSAVAA